MQLCILLIVVISQKIVSGYQNVRKLMGSKFIICMVTLNDSTVLGNDKYVSFALDYRR